MQLPKLNFPKTYQFEIFKDKDRFFIQDSVRKTRLVLTPEEWVRQHWIRHFLEEKNYSASALILERKIELNGLTKRIDLLVTEKTQAKILLEFKAPSITLSAKTFEQTARYNSVVGAKEIILSNGLEHIRAKLGQDGYQFIPFTF